MVVLLIKTVKILNTVKLNQVVAEEEEEVEKAQEEEEEEADAINNFFTLLK